MNPSPPKIPFQYSYSSFQEKSPAWNHEETTDCQKNPQTDNTTTPRSQSGLRKAQIHHTNVSPLTAYMEAVRTDTQRVKIDKASYIVNDANRFAMETMKDPAYPLKLLAKVITVSLETNRIVSELKAVKFED